MSTQQDEYWGRFLLAQDSGLNREACIAVANKEMTLDQALGGMDHDAEVAAMICEGVAAECDRLAENDDGEMWGDEIPW